MTSTDWIHYIQDAYSTEPEHPWADKPEFSVFRHASNKKWFALFMSVKASLLGLPGAEEVPVLNLKADPRLIGPQREKPGFLPYEQGALDHRRARRQRAGGRNKDSACHEL